MKKKIFPPLLFPNRQIFILLCLLWFPFFLKAQTNVCAPATIVATTTGYNATVGYNQVYVLADNNGVIVASSATGTFSGVSAGNYTVHALNYATSDVPTNVNGTTNNVILGVNLSSITGGCMNSDFLTDTRAFSVTACGCNISTSICTYDAVIGTSSGYNTNYVQMYFLTDLNGNILAKNTTGNFGNQGVGSYRIYALNYNPSDPPAPILTATNVTQIGSTDNYCYNESDFLSDYKCVNVTNCGCTPICFGRPIVASTTGSAFGQLYDQVFVLTDDNGIVLSSSFTNPASFPTGNLVIGNTYRVYALNYDVTNPPNVIPLVNNSTDMDNISGGCFDIIGSPESYKCFIITPNASNPSAVTQADATTNVFPVCANAPENSTSNFTSPPFSNTCVPSLNTGIAARFANNQNAGNQNISPEQLDFVNKINMACNGSLDFSNAPLIYSVLCTTDDSLKITISPPTNIDGTITSFEAALFGPVAAGCLSMTSTGSFVDCNSDTDNADGISALSLLDVGTVVNSVYFVLIDTKGGTGDFIITAQGTNAVPLPIRLLSFEGQNVGNENFLYWQTSAEVNSSHFEVERSEDNVNFVPIGENVVAAGFSNTPKNYNLIDKNPVQGINYYRLRMLDKDGKVDYSNTIELFVNSLSLIEIYPNPFDNQLIISTEGISGEVTFLLYNEIGQCVSNQKWNLSEIDKHLQTISIENLSSGAYFYRFLSDNFKRNGKLIRE